MSYYIPVNNIPIECTRDMWAEFQDTVCETYYGVTLWKNSSVGYPHCFHVVIEDPFGKETFSKAYTKYEDAFRRYKNLKARQIRNDIRLSKGNKGKQTKKTKWGNNMSAI